MNILIAFASKEGQTEKIAEFIADVVRHHGHQAKTLPCHHLPKDFDITSFDAVIIGGSIHMNKYPGYLNKFVTTYLDSLNQVPSALFTVCMATHSENEKERIAADAFGPALSQKTQWQPNVMETFAGAIKYTQYGFITRKIMQSIARKEGGDTDTSRDFEYTDWEKVTQFTERFLSQIGIKVETAMEE